MPNCIITVERFHGITTINLTVSGEDAGSLSLRFTGIYLGRFRASAQKSVHPRIPVRVTVYFWKEETVKTHADWNHNIIPNQYHLAQT